MATTYRYALSVVGQTTKDGDRAGHPVTDTGGSWLVFNEHALVYDYTNLPFSDDGEVRYVYSIIGQTSPFDFTWIYGRLQDITNGVTLAEVALHPDFDRFEYNYATGVWPDNALTTDSVLQFQYKVDEKVAPVTPFPYLLYGMEVHLHRG